MDSAKLNQFLAALRPELANVDWAALARRVLVENPQAAMRELPGRLQSATDLLMQYNPGGLVPNQPPTPPEVQQQLLGMAMDKGMAFAPMGITAYHGSPYLFRQFDPTKRGTGEGAQMYGVGAGYTAEAKAVGDKYRQDISSGLFETGNKQVFDPSKLEHLNVKTIANRGDLEGAIKKAKEIVASNSPVADKAARDLEVLRSIQGAGGIQPTQGYLYKGDIPDEILPKFLDLDKPLSEQSKEVQEVVRKLGLGETASGSKNPTGAYIYESLARRLNPFDNSIKATSNPESASLASKKLEEFGIRGIKYLDEASRGSFKAQLTYKGQPYSDVIEFKTKAQLDDYIKENKEKGFGVKTFPQTSNFIPFRPEDYKVQEINDIPIEDWISRGLL